MASKELSAISKRRNRTKSKPKRSKIGKCYWFTGTSGTRVRHALTTLASEFQTPSEIVSVEDEILVAFAHHSNPVDAAARQQHLANLKRPGGFKQILDQAPSLVQELWLKAAGSACRRAQTHLDTGKNVFLTFHAVYYADKFSDFYSPLDIRAFQKFPKPAKFLTLIDDIGDVADRLREDGQVFSNRKRAGVRSVIDAIRDLLTVLEWRSTELTISRLLGSLVGCPPFVLAVKHPVKTAARIVQDDGVPAYISHSISESRRKFKKTGKWGSFPSEVQRFTDTLANGEVGGRVNKVIPIVPTAIDELRIRSVKVDRQDILIPSLLDRWDLPAGTLLVPSPGNPPSLNWLDPCGHFKGKLTEPMTTETAREVMAVDGLLQALHTRIDNQINARDHMLVEQCAHFVVYRPYVAWRVSRGVEAEISHRERLANRGKPKGKTVFLHRRATDDRLRRLGTIVEGAKLYFRWVKEAQEIADDELEELLREKLEEGAPASFSPDDIEVCVKKYLKEEGIEFGGLRWTEDAKILDKKSSAESDEDEKLLWERISSEAKKPDPWRSHADAWIQRDSTAEQLADELVRRL